MTDNVVIPDIYVFVTFFVFLLLVTILCFLLGRLHQAGKTQKKNTLQIVDLENKLSREQLEKIETKLNPHLFKNVLNSIQSHAFQTYISLDKLASVLDYILYESPDQLVSPKDEIDFALNLIEINKIKVNPLYDIKVKTNIDKTDSLYEEKVVAPFISIDLIENAFKHGDFQSKDAFIHIFLDYQKTTLSIKVVNKVLHRSSLTQEYGGYGVQALEKRLQVLYKNNFKLERKKEGDTYTAELKINLVGYKNKMHIVR